MCVSVLLSSGSPLDDLSDSDTEDLVDLKIDDWLVFQLDKEVREQLLSTPSFSLLNGH